ncbi:N-acetyltransferase [Planomonospora parontospora subsp. parontospora]|uniref:N-acetyltransferase n=2 Tax=Planomonospora parontospora TaxID=58119 RepID=A0AA37BHL8_9ACTN|nr:GNAT family N-acetyltransferase [Planomonospora parontospora]GGK72869.1 N-acetyltransferase [Planomonospora parontospora]GII09327.1 N-acetyltransferase [Planomonospora parontospora subsp. parontospora]
MGSAPGSTSAEVRWATADELPGLAAVEIAADGVFAQVGITFPAGTTMVEETDDPSRVLVAGDPPVGFAMFGWIDGNVHLDQLAVHPDHGRRGAGGRLVEAVCVHAASVGSAAVTLTTFRDVPWNGPWYRRRGFAVLDPAEWGPEMAALVAHERELGIELAPRVVMRRVLSSWSPS